MKAKIFDCVLIAWVLMVTVFSAWFLLDKISAIRVAGIAQQTSDVLNQMNQGIEKKLSEFSSRLDEKKK